MASYARRSDLTETFEVDESVVQDGTFTKLQVDAAEVTIFTKDEVGGMYNEMLNEAYGSVTICGLEYAASIALYGVDEIAYDTGLNEYMFDEFVELAESN